MNAKRNYSLADILSIALAPVARTADPIIDVEQHYVPMKRSAPMPVRAIFNLKTEDMVAVLDDDGNPVYEQTAGENLPKRIVKRAKTLENPILASKVFFDDGSWTVVKNSGEDTVDVEEKKLSNGKTVKVATYASKEHAIAYAVVKRAFGHVDPVTKEVRDANLGRRFEKIISASIDQNVKNVEDKTKKAEAKPTQKVKPKKTQCRCHADNEKIENFLKNSEGIMTVITELAKKLNLGKVVEGDQGA